MEKIAKITKTLDERLSEQFPDFDLNSPFKEYWLKWEMKYKHIWEFTSDYNGKKIYSYLQKPDKYHLMRFFQQYFKNKMEAKMGLYNNLVLEHSLEINNDDFLYLSFVNQIFSTIKLYSSEIKETISENSPFFNISNKITSSGNFYEIKIFNDEKSYFLYIKKPMRMVIAEYYNLSEQDLIVSGNYLIDTLKIEFSPEIFSDDNVYISTLLKIGDIVNTYGVSIKKK